MDLNNEIKAAVETYLSCNKLSKVKNDINHCIKFMVSIKK